MKLLLLVVLALAATTPAWAQSKKYPPAPVDKELEREQHSHLWDQALQPGSADYLVLLDLARASLQQRTDDERKFAVEKLTEAIKLMPERTEAYALRGTAYFQTALASGATDDPAWTTCADDLAVAEARLGAETCAVTIDDACVYDRSDMRRELGLCQGRSGRYGDAERTFEMLTAERPNDGEVWMRLGEVRIAMGKLDEAISALGTALDRTPDGMQESSALWLLAGAYDRRRQPADAVDAVNRARISDPPLTAIVNATPPLLPTEADYLLALAYLLPPPGQQGGIPNMWERPEYALVYLRRFITAAPEGPWRKRADEHLHDIQAMQLPVAFQVLGAFTDRDALRGTVSRAMPAMRACLAKLPNIVLSVEIRTNGPRSPDRPFLRLPPEGVRVPAQSTIPSSAPQNEVSAAAACVQRVAENIRLPRLTDKDTQRVVSFYVVAP